MARKITWTDLVDLHVHSRASDGEYPPREVVRLAKEAGLRAVAIADHDTTAGVAEALAAGQEFGVEVIPAVEVSTEFADGACHLLGYFVDPADEALEAVLCEARAGREWRNRRILERLEALGMPLEMAEVQRQVSSGVTTRAHFAAALLEKGHVKTWDEAFDKYLGRDKLAYVPRRRVEPAEAIRVIRGAGGLASLAHPRQLNRPADETEEWFAHLARCGLEAVETQSPDHSAALANCYKVAAERLGLLETGGTDWHGRNDSSFRLGVGGGAMRVRYEVVERMKERLARRGNRA